MKVTFLHVPNPGTDPAGFEMAMNANLATLAAAMELVVFRDRRETMLAPLDFARPQNTSEDRPTTMNGYFRWRDDLALTSRPYAIVTTEGMDFGGEATGGYEFSVILDALDFGAAITGGTLYGGLVSYEEYPPEAIDFFSPSVEGGTLYGGLTSFSLEPEAFDYFNPTVLGGEFYGGLISYDNYPLEAIDFSMSVLSGSFS